MPAVLTVQVGTQWPPEVEWCCIYCGIGHCLLLWRGYSTIQLENAATTVDRWGTRWEGGGKFRDILIQSLTEMSCLDCWFIRPILGL